MCVNKDLLDKKASRSQKVDLEEFYTIGKKLTKDTNGDGHWTNLSTEYLERKKGNGGHLFQGEKHAC